MFLMLLGYVLGRRGFFSAETVRQMNRFTFRFCVSAMMFRGIYTLSSLSDIGLDTMCFVLVSVIVLTAMGWAEGSSVCAGIQVPVIICNNIMAATVLTICSSRQECAPGPRAVLKRIAVNPMILGQVAGIVCLVIRQFVPRSADGTLAFSLARDLPFLYSAIDSLASLTMPPLLVLRRMGLL